ncbi:uncharacterized protein LOC111876763 isoform X5 [Lactuca sativa]|uniref:uncharacterized protein LOC111876763 isoform X5 n=1 Tax=Lactuca sativa TaxID=4236 RepID=UPI0022AE8DB6|nr:uncharacterized protein LOC111876763 isoform X5 [Lactuca sativa]
MELSSHAMGKTEKKFSATNYIYIQCWWGSRNSKMLSFHTPALKMSDARVLLSALHNFIRTLSKKLSHVLWERQKKFSFTNYIHIQSKWGSRNSKMLSFHTPDKEGILCHQLYSYSVQESRDEVAKSLELGFMMINKNGLLEGRFSM